MAEYTEQFQLSFSEITLNHLLLTRSLYRLFLLLLLLLLLMMMLMLKMISVVNRHLRPVKAARRAVR